MLSLGGYLAGFLLGVQHMEGVAGCRSTVETEDDGRGGRAGVVDALVALVEHGLNASPACAGNHDVALMERSVAYEHSADIAAPLVERRLDDRTRTLAVGVGLEVEHIGFEEHFLHELIHTNAFLGRNLLALVFTAPVLHEEIHIGQILTYFIGIGSRLINLVDGKAS